MRQRADSMGIRSVHVARFSPVSRFTRHGPNQIRFRNNTDRGGSVSASEWDMPWEGIGFV